MAVKTKKEALKNKNKKRSEKISGLGIFLIALILAKLLNLPRNLIIISVFLLTIIELFRFSYKFTPFTKESLIFPQTKTTSYLSNQERRETGVVNCASIGLTSQMAHDITKGLTSIVFTKKFL